MSGSMPRYRHLALVALVACVALGNLAFGSINTASAEASGPESMTGAGRSRVMLPLIAPPPTLSTRLGYGAVGRLAGYGELPTLRAGWYANWMVEVAPSRPNGMEFVQTVRFHQKLACVPGSPNQHNRTLCPYQVPWDYEVFPDRNTIAAAAKTNRGALWLLGNEMDRRDWLGGGQDEMLPELYARAYHDLYTWIKQADPLARIAIGGVIQATPLRLEYLTKAWNTYQSTYGQPMPVDVWNVHNFILREEATGNGAGIPPGSTALTGKLYEVGDHISLVIFNEQIRAFRQWMKDRGQQDKPLVVSEYGVLYFHGGLEDPDKVQNFMTHTFDYFLNTRDCTLGLQSDQCRLVQKWNWYSLDDSSGTFNIYGSLFNASSRQITSTGVKFRTWSLANMKALK